MSLLQSNAMIVKLAVKDWPATKHDPLLAADLTQRYNAEDKAATVSKRLISKDALRDIRSAISAARSLHDTMTLPWGKHGERLLPVAMHQNYTDRIDRCANRLEEARKVFLDQYEALIEEAKITLGRMFDGADYPTRDQAAEKFGLAYEISPVPDAAHFVADLADKQADRIKADLEKRTRIKLDNAVVRLYERIEESLRRLIDRLGTDDKGKPKRIHASALETMQQIADAVPAMNLTNDSQLTDIGARIRKVLKSVEIDDLRHKSRKSEAVEMVNLRREKLSGALDSIATAYFGSSVSDSDS